MRNFKVVDHNSPAYRQTVILRDKILRAPLGLKFTEEQLAAEHDCLHLAGYENDELTCCLVLQPIDKNVIKMRQVAVDEGLQGKGWGSALVQASELLAVDRGFQTMMCHARGVAVDFYERLGYSIKGEMFEEVTIPHWRMEKQLT